MKCLPGQRTGDRVCVGEEATAYNEIERRVQFEKEEFTRLQCPKWCSAWRPKVDLSKSRSGSEILEPIPIGYRNEEPNSHGVGGPLSRSLSGLVHGLREIIQWSGPSEED